MKETNEFLTVCPKCGEITSVDLKKRIDENGEIIMCEHCGFLFT